MDVVSVAETLVLVGLFGGAMYLTFRELRLRAGRISTTMSKALDGLTTNLFEAPPTRTTKAIAGPFNNYKRAINAMVALEGTVEGTSTRIAARTSEVNSNHALEGYANAVIELEATVGLKGATPRFSVSSKPGKHVGGARDHVREAEFLEAFTVEGDPSIAAEVFDDALRTELFRFAGGARVVSGRPGQADPSAVSITATSEGLTLRWFADNAAIEFKETERAAEERDAAIAAERKRVRDANAIVRTMGERLLQAVERQTARVRVHGDVDAYRVAAQREVALEEDETEDATQEPAKRAILDTPD